MTTRKIAVEELETRELFQVDPLDTFCIYKDSDLSEEVMSLIQNSHYHMEVASSSQTEEAAFRNIPTTDLSADEFMSLLIKNGFHLEERADNQTECSFFVRKGKQIGIAIGAVGPGGGLIFWVNGDLENDLIALEVAPSGWHLGNESDPTIVWGTSDEFTFPKMKKAVGSGLANCEVIDESDFLCPALPSVDELQLIYENIHLSGLGSLTGEQYWTSTPFFSPFVYSIIFSDGEQMMSNVQMAFSVRPIRQIRRD
jgi:hypothetical protein